MFFEAFLTPQGIIIEAENENDFKKRLKNISIKNFVFDHKQITKEELKQQFEKRCIYVNMDKRNKKC